VKPDTPVRIARPFGRRADGHVFNLPIGWKVAEQHEVPQRVAHRLLVQGGPEEIARAYFGRGFDRFLP
jgi:hypothetical protein